MSRAMSPPPFGTFFPSPFGLYSHCMAALYWDTQGNDTMYWAEWWGGFWWIIQQLWELISTKNTEKSYRNAGGRDAHTRTLVSYSWRNVTVQKSKLHQTAQVIIATARRLCHHRAWKQWRKPQKEASAQPPQPRQKEEECWKQYKDAINSSCHSITGSQRTRAMSRDTPLFILAKR